MTLRSWSTCQRVYALGIQTDEQHDPWAAARGAARDDVVAALAPRERRCPSCGAVQRAGGRRCDRCGADLTARLERGRSRRAWVFAGLVALVLAAIAAPVVAGLREDAAGERERAAERQARIKEAERVRQARDSVPVRATGPAAAAGAFGQRDALVRLGEEQITADARQRVAAGTLDGDVKGTQCDVFPATEGRRAAEQDPATPSGRYDCVAYSSKLEGFQGRTAVFGHPFWLVIDYERAKLVWCKVTPRAGEGGSVLVTVPVPEPCRDPAGPG